MPMPDLVFRDDAKNKRVPVKLWCVPGHFYSPIPDTEQLSEPRYRGLERVYSATSGDDSTGNSIGSWAPKTVSHSSSCASARQSIPGIG